jgi:hypothetical protein
MKKTILAIGFWLLAMGCQAQQSQRVMILPPEGRSVAHIPGKGNIDVEQLNKQTNLNQDISQLNITELRVLRNSFYAREGYPFRDAFLRGVFQCTSWYDSLMGQRWAKVDELME